MDTEGKAVSVYLGCSPTNIVKAMRDFTDADAPHERPWFFNRRTHGRKGQKTRDWER